PRAGGANLLGRDVGRALEGAALEVACRQRAEAVEREEVGGRAELAVFGGRRTERPLGEVLPVLGKLPRMGPFAAPGAAQRDCLDVLAAEHRAAAAAAGGPAGGGDGAVQRPAL